MIACDRGGFVRSLGWDYTYNKCDDTLWGLGMLCRRVLRSFGRLDDALCCLESCNDVLWGLSDAGMDSGGLSDAGMDSRLPLTEAIADASSNNP